MTTTFRADVRAALITILTAQKDATPTLLKRVEPSRPGGFAETPCAYVSGMVEDITQDAGTRTRRLTGLEVTIVDSYREGVNDTLDQLVDALVDRFTDNVQAVGNAIIELTRVADDEVVVEAADRPPTYFRAVVLTFARTAKWEGRG